MDILKIIDMSSSVVQVIDVPKIISHDSIPQRMLLSEPQRLVEQLVDVPVPEAVTLPRGRDAAGIEWSQVAGRGGIYWWMVRTRYAKWDRPKGFTASPGRKTNTGQG